MLTIPHQDVLDRLIELQRIVQKRVIEARGESNLHEVSHHSEADTIYKIDAHIDALVESFCEEWSKATPLVLISEGIEGGQKVFPSGAREADAKIRLIIDPIDGTRGLMYDKRAAWTLAGVAPNNGPSTRLRDIEVAVMTELPTSKMGFGDVLSAIKGQGAVGKRVDLRNGDSEPLELKPSNASGIDHGFAMISNFFPGTKVLASETMEHIARNLLGPADVKAAAVFDDQYISTGGQFYELIVGHDRFNADLRPIFYGIQNQPEGLCCHPYDCATMLIAEEAGVILTDGLGAPLDGPLDVTTGISWAGFANSKLHLLIEPLLTSYLRELGA